MIELVEIKKSRNLVQYEFVHSEDLSDIFTGDRFEIWFPESIEKVPDSILAIPFVASTIQIAWIQNSELRIPVLDEDFYLSLGDVLEGYKTMYPDVCFYSNVLKTKTERNVKRKNGKTAMFFSGGLDATTTLLKHIDEKPMLITLWGADIPVDNYDGWSIVENGLKMTACEYRLLHRTIRTSFRKFDDEKGINDRYYERLGTNWWYGIKHGLAIIGHAAPLAWMNGIDVIYMASSNCIEDGPQKCASDPLLDNAVRYFGTVIKHDCYEINRQDKTQFIANYHKANPSQRISLHVCWESGTGENCCRCEKCLRTIAGLMIEGVNPNEFGFIVDNSIYTVLFRKIALREQHIPAKSWTYMKRRLIENWDMLVACDPNKRKLKWIKKFDFINIDNNYPRRLYSMTCVVKSHIAKLFPLHYEKYKKHLGVRIK